MAKVVIVSRTKMKNGVCCGGFNLETGEFIRLHTAKGANLPVEAPYNVGQVFDLKYKTAWNPRPKPHVEDKQVFSGEYIKQLSTIELRQAIINNCPVLEGDLSSVFQGFLKPDKYAMYIGQNAVPEYSVCFWRPNAPLKLVNFMGKPRYYFNGQYISFVGFQSPVNVIPAGTLVRLSLANWWSPDGNPKNLRCYLQISGWY